eukprot:3747750-Amphidinium_carterae.1
MPDEPREACAEAHKHACARLHAPARSHTRDDSADQHVSHLLVFGSQVQIDANFTSKDGHHSSSELS